MKALLMMQLTDDQYVSTNAPERLPEQTEWVDGAHAPGDVVTVDAVKRVYRCAYATKVGDPSPNRDIADNQIAKWQDIGAMNRWGVFDSRVTTVTIGPTGDLVFVVRPGAIQSIWVGGIEAADAVRVQVLNKPNGDIVYDETRLLHEPVTTWWGWWFAPFTSRADVLFSDIEMWPKCEVTVTLQTLNIASVGMIAMGSIESLGETLWDPETRFVNYSAKKLDDTWGPKEGTGGTVARDQSLVIAVDLKNAPRVSKFMDRAMKMPAVWISSEKDEFEGLRGFGQAVDGTLKYANPAKATLNLTIRGFI